jgi:hypothetical protein
MDFDKGGKENRMSELDIRVKGSLPSNILTKNKQSYNGCKSE